MPDHPPPDPMPRRSLLTPLDEWMAQHPWHPRIIPFVVYVGLLPAIGGLRDWQPWSYPLAYLVQCGLVLALLLRYRTLLPELTWRFHWLAIPVGVGVTAAWIALGHLAAQTFPDLLAAPPGARHYLAQLEPQWLRWTSLGLRLLGMSLLVPMFEELVMRSLLLRSFHSFRRTCTAGVQIIQDLPVIGDLIQHTHLAQRADHHDRPLAYQFEVNPLGRLSVFGVAASTLVFMVHHHPRDWMGCIVCGVAYCLLLAATCGRESCPRGLGPVVWAHGITNALLWLYVVQTGDWQFL